MAGKRAMSGYALDEGITDGDIVFQGPLRVKTGHLTDAFFTGLDDVQPLGVHRWHSALPKIAEWLQEHPDAGKAIEDVLSEGDWRYSKLLLDDGFVALRALISALTPEAGDAVPQP